MKKSFQRLKRMLVLGIALIIALSIFAIPASAETIYAYVSAADGLTAYSNASLSDKIGVIDAYKVVAVVGYSGSTAAVLYNGYGCYVNLDGLTLLVRDDNERVITRKTRVYAAPDTSAASISVPKGMTVYEIRRYGNWAEVANGLYVAYISTDDLRDASEPEPTQTPDASESIPATVTSSGARVYYSADTSSPSLELPVGTKVTVHAISGSWCYLEVNGVYAYCKLSNLTADAYLTKTPEPTATPVPTATATPDEVIPATVTASGAKLYASPNTSAANIDISVGSKVNVLKISGEWTYLEYNGVYAYCKITYLTADSYLEKIKTPEPTATPAPTTAAVIPATVTAANAKVYASPSTSAQSMTVSQGLKVNVVLVSGEWAQIERNGLYAYCKISILTADSELADPTPTPTTGESVVATVTGTSAKLYAAANTSAQSVSLSVGTVLQVYQIANDWAYVVVNGVNGYCKVSDLTPGTIDVVTPAPTATSGNVIPAVVTASSLAVYQYPSTSSTRYGTLSKGTTLNVTAISGDWAQVEKNGAYGYCMISGLAPVSSQETPNPMEGYIEETFDATVITSDARFYASPDTDSNSYSLPIGTTVTVKAYTAKWAYAQVNGVMGFIPVSALSRNNYTPMRSGATGSDVKQLENALLVMGYLDTVPGTKYNDYTVSSVKRFQTACGLTATGEADIATLRVLYGGHAPSSSVLSGSYSSGSSGENVGHIQLRLYALGYLSKASSVDCDYGSITSNAVKLFQSYNDLSTSGSADSSTLRKLYSTSAVSLPSGKTPADVSSVIIYDAGDQQNNSTKISSSLASTTSSPGSTTASKLEYVIYIGQNQLGKPYVYGANGTSSYDCTGFTCYCFKQIGISLKRSAVDQGYDNTYTKISSISDLQRGDLVYFDTISDSDLSDHAGIYLGGGFFIHASSGQGKVVISTLASGYYNRVFSWGRRALKS